MDVKLLINALIWMEIFITQLRLHYIEFVNSDGMPVRLENQVASS